jgi:hypothetical protein
LGLSLLLGIALVGHWVFERRSDFLQQKLSRVHASLHLAKRQLEELDLVLGEQEKRWQILAQQQGWREGFACQQRWLRDLGAKLPADCLVEKVTVNSGRWQLVVHCSQEFQLKNLMQGISALQGLEQVNVRQFDAEEKLDLFRIEFNAASQCR